MKWAILTPYISDVQVLEDIRRVVGDDAYRPQQPAELCSRIFTTCYMASENSSAATCNRAKELANQIGRYGHVLHVVYLEELLLKHIDSHILT